MRTKLRSHSTNRLTLARIAVLLAAALQILTPLMPLFGIGQPIGSQSAAVRTVITPAGWAFSIWGALYTGSSVFAIYQALPSQRDNALLKDIRWPAAGAFLGNATWAAYTQLFGLSMISVLIIVAALTCLLIIYTAVSSAALTTGDRWCAYLPLSALSAWLTVATTVNIAASLRYHGIEGGAAAPVIGAVVIVVAGLIGAGAIVRGRGNAPYAGIFFWALAAIYSAGGQRSSLIATATFAAAALVVVGLIIGQRAQRDLRKA